MTPRRLARCSLGRLVTGRAFAGTIRAAMALPMLILALGRRFVEATPSWDSPEERREACRSGLRAWLISFAVCIPMMALLGALKVPLLAVGLVLLLVQLLGVRWALCRHWQRDEDASRRQSTRHAPATVLDEEELRRARRVAWVIGAGAWALGSLLTALVFALVRVAGVSTQHTALGLVVWAVWIVCPWWAVRQYWRRREERALQTERTRAKWEKRRPDRSVAAPQSPPNGQTPTSPPAPLTPPPVVPSAPLVPPPPRRPGQ